MSRSGFRLVHAICPEFAIPLRTLADSSLRHRSYNVLQTGAWGCPLSATSRHRNYSITSSARARSNAGTESPSALAVLRLIASSYLVGACTGSSPGFSPLRMRST
jgi:hypothetical protein